jgi:hypothetical protein
MSLEPNLFESYRSKLRNAEVSHVWRVHGSALFVEFGLLSPGRAHADGRLGNPTGEFGVMVQWSWRIEDGTRITCGSWSNEELWPPTFARLIGKKIVDISLVGRLPEIEIELSDDLHFLSFMTADGEPEWTIFDRTAESGQHRWLKVKDGRLVEDRSA